MTMPIPSVMNETRYAQGCHVSSGSLLETTMPQLEAGQLT
eukprot:CAMPEP_0183600448 /NCGR_PEP_ID=MMETSP0371-20130417/179943_1 /TAXON_ID=268820 /ORGANISM="Peridinium aciculiferum, Strain PAER-2" /LENGTH=39 /DNA_ID= /DNA_START= /DNA_END= /DNA_ORIENTATION=